MKLTPINAPRIAPVPGTRTINAQQAREAAMSKFNEGLQTQGSPSQENVTLDPATPPIIQDTLEGVSESQPPSLNAAPEVVAEPSATEPAVDPREAKLASHYANLARKEKALRAREAQLRQKEAQFSPTTPTTPSPAPQDLTQYVNKNDLISNPFGILNDLGLTYEQLTQKALDAPSNEDLQQRREIEALRAELKALKQNSDEIKKSFEENQTSARRQAEQQIKQDVTRLVANDPRFEVVKDSRSVGEVVNLITSVFDKGMGDDYPPGTVLDIEEAAQMIEDELMARALKLTQLKKIQSRLNQGLATPGVAQKQQPTQQQSQLKTLTNSVGTPSRQMSARERAIAAMRGENVS